METTTKGVSAFHLAEENFGPLGKAWSVRGPDGRSWGSYGGAKAQGAARAKMWELNKAYALGCAGQSELVAAVRDAELLTDRMSNPSYGFRADMKTVQRDCAQLLAKCRAALSKAGVSHAE